MLGLLPRCHWFARASTSLLLVGRASASLLLVGRVSASLLLVGRASASLLLVGKCLLAFGWFRILPPCHW